ncbi:MAG: tyrosine-type recombinase/integrase [Tannerellaceae bacterium]|nr:tyrosine-type recombinase/integrase [Tannerellaceae bacterium]
MDIINADGKGCMEVEDAIGGFLFHCRYEKNLNVKTVGAYQTDLLQFAEFLREAMEVVDLMGLDRAYLKGYLQSLEGLKPKTVKRKIATLKAMFNFREYENDDFISPFRKMKVRFKQPYVLPTVMNMQEVRKMMLVVYRQKERIGRKEGYRFRSVVRDIAVIELLFATGIRVSELCNLRPEEVDLRNGRVKVFGKGSKERVIQICQAEILVALKEYFRLFSEQIRSRGYFFINRLGQRLSTQSVRLMIRQYARLAGISKPVTPHTFRHTFATLLLEEDVDIKYIQSLLGHSSISTTQIYTHVNAGKQKRILATKHPRRKICLQQPEK